MIKNNKKNKHGYKTSYSDVKELVKNFRVNKDLPFITNSCVIDADKLKKFVQSLDKLDKEVKAVKIYLWRGQIKNPKLGSKMYLMASDQYTQVSFLIVPHDNLTGCGNDIVDGKNKILCLYPNCDNEGSGLCPPLCGNGDS